MTDARPWCPRCRRALAMCWCGHLRPFRAEVLFAILMHPKESRVAIGTGRMAHRSLTGSHLFVGERFEGDPRLAELLADPTLAPVILYPSPGALDLAHATPEDARALFPSGRRPLVILVDGTWTTAKKLLKLAPSLRALPAIRFTPGAPSRYDRLRKEPRPECCSTIESVYWVLAHLAALGIAPPPPASAHDHLLALLDATVAAQLAFEPPEHRSAPRGQRAPCSARGERDTREP